MRDLTCFIADRRQRTHGPIQLAALGTITELAFPASAFLEIYQNTLAPFCLALGSAKKSSFTPYNFVAAVTSQLHKPGIHILNQPFRADDGHGIRTLLHRLR